MNSPRIWSLILFYIKRRLHCSTVYHFSLKITFRYQSSFHTFLPFSAQAVRQTMVLNTITTIDYISSCFPGILGGRAYVNISFALKNLIWKNITVHDQDRMILHSILRNCNILFVNCLFYQLEIRTALHLLESSTNLVFV